MGPKPVGSPGPGALITFQNQHLSLTAAFQLLRELDSESERQALFVLVERHIRHQANSSDENHIEFLRLREDFPELQTQANNTNMSATIARANIIRRQVDKQENLKNLLLADHFVTDKFLTSILPRLMGELIVPRKTLEQLRCYQKKGNDIMQILRDAERIRHQRLNSNTMDALNPNLTLADLRNASKIKTYAIEPPIITPRNARKLAGTHNRTRHGGIRWHDNLEMFFPQVNKKLDQVITQEWKELETSVTRWLRTRVPSEPPRTPSASARPCPSPPPHPQSAPPTSEPETPCPPVPGRKRRTSESASTKTSRTEYVTVTSEDAKIEGLGQILKRLEINASKTPSIAAGITNPRSDIPLPKPSPFQLEIWNYIIQRTTEYFKHQEYEPPTVNIMSTFANLNKQKADELRDLSDAIAANGHQPDWLRDFVATMFLQAMRLTMIGLNSGTTSTQFIIDQADILAAYLAPGDTIRRDALVVGADAHRNGNHIVLRSELMRELAVTAQTRGGWLGVDTMYTLLRLFTQQGTFVVDPDYFNWFYTQMAAHGNLTLEARQQAALADSELAERLTLPATARGNVIVPINLGGDHWGTIMFRPPQGGGTEGEIFAMDSFNNPIYLNDMFNAGETFARNEPRLRRYTWRRRVDIRSQNQTNTWDCGIYAIENALQLDRGRETVGLPIIQGNSVRAQYAEELMNLATNHGHQLPRRNRARNQYRPLTPGQLAERFDVDKGRTVSPSGSFAQLTETIKRSKTPHTPGLKSGDAKLKKIALSQGAKLKPSEQEDEDIDDANDDGETHRGIQLRPPVFNPYDSIVASPPNPSQILNQQHQPGQSDYRPTTQPAVQPPGPHIPMQRGEPPRDSQDWQQWYHWMSRSQANTARYSGYRRAGGF